MAAQDDRPEPEEMTYLFRNCDHEYVGNFANRPENTESIQGPEPFQRDILEQLSLVRSSQNGFLDLGSVFLGASPLVSEYKISRDVTQPNANVIFPRFCLPCLTARKARLRALGEDEVCVFSEDEKGWLKSEKLAYGRVLAESMDFKWGNKAHMDLALRLPNPYVPVGMYYAG
ncbi:uncharacterized protein RAG0_01516 [Rhynchosporium agropyri]|uniref:Uncharacterized protein n=1 Tax=Rhynchosporium agropyri TaxID=914238 RepID=A0A1E1JX47_9HELO|nr:uncharacterized protein RAG0_01516 [Rhynchosporium agropyri]